MGQHVFVYCERVKSIMLSIHKMVKHTLKTLATRFKHVFDHFVKARHERVNSKSLFEFSDQLHIVHFIIQFLFVCDKDYEKMSNVTDIKSKNLLTFRRT